MDKILDFLIRNPLNFVLRFLHSLPPVLLCGFFVLLLLSIIFHLLRDYFFSNNKPPD